MAKGRRRRKSFRNYMKGNIQIIDNFGTLDAQDLSSAITNSVNDTTRVSSCKCTYAANKLTQGAGIGPFIFGVCHSDYSDTEIEEYLENAGSWEIGNMVQREVAQRRIRRIGVIMNENGATGTNTFNDGRPITTKLNWLLQEGQSLRFWIYNNGSAATATTVPEFSVQGHANLWAQ